MKVLVITCYSMCSLGSLGMTSSADVAILMQNNSDGSFKILAVFGLVLSLIKMVTDLVKFCCVNTQHRTTEPTSVGSQSYIYRYIKCHEAFQIVLQKDVSGTSNKYRQMYVPRWLANTVMILACNWKLI